MRKYVAAFLIGWFAAGGVAQADGEPGYGVEQPDNAVVYVDPNESVPGVLPPTF